MAAVFVPAVHYTPWFCGSDHRSLAIIVVFVSSSYKLLLCPAISQLFIALLVHSRFSRARDSGPYLLLSFHILDVFCPVFSLSAPCVCQAGSLACVADLNTSRGSELASQLMRFLGGYASTPKQADTQTDTQQNAHTNTQNNSENSASPAGHSSSEPLRARASAPNRAKAPMTCHVTLASAIIGLRMTDDERPTVSPSKVSKLQQPNTLLLCAGLTEALLE